jgi:hypothetical protein
LPPISRPAENIARGALQNARDALLMNEYDDGVFDEAAVEAYAALLQVHASLILSELAHFN